MVNFFPYAIVFMAAVLQLYASYDRILKNQENPTSEKKLFIQSLEIPNRPVPKRTKPFLRLN
jgi:hypothetical protein